jgi:ornithine cyclodeaminase
VYDLRQVHSVDIDEKYRDMVVICSSWQEVYEKSRVFMTCTVSSAPYIDIPPRKGTLQLNISLRDYKAELIKYVDMMIVDDWEEICRENTDVEQMHLKYGLQKSGVLEIYDALYGGNWDNLDEKVVMFNPMGMAMYDIAVGRYYYDKSIELAVGLTLEE